ncbi:MAG: alpha/beta hydrolase, partial [Phycisphaerae bacterium]
MHWNILHIIFYIWLFFTMIYGGFGLTLYLMQPKLTYRPIRDVPYTPEEIGLEFEDLTLKTEDGIAISAWYIPAPESKYTILLCHGNGGNIMHRLDNINIFYNLGVNCLIFDYRGYGNSQGKPTEQGTYKDAM